MRKRSKEQGFAVTMALQLWQSDRDWMAQNAPPYGQYSWDWYMRKVGSRPTRLEDLPIEEQRAYVAQKVREHRTRTQADPFERAKHLVKRYIREGKLAAAKRVHEQATAEVPKYSEWYRHERITAEINQDHETLARLDKEREEFLRPRRA